MKLSRQDAQTFFKLMWSLLTYANQKLKILPNEITIDEFASLPYELILEVRDALFDEAGLIDSYVRKNPEGFTAEELEIVRGWKHFIRGHFFIERLLKKYAIFISDEAVYGVLGIYNSLEEVIPPKEFPYYVRALLLPFKGKIVYDGLLERYDFSYSGNIKADLRVTYMAAKQNGTIIENLESTSPVVKPAVSKKKEKEWRGEVENIALQVEGLRVSAGSPPIHGPAFGLAQASIEFARTVVYSPDDLDELWKAIKKVERQLRRAETMLNRADFESSRDLRSG